MALYKSTIHERTLRMTKTVYYGARRMAAQRGRARRSFLVRVSQREMACWVWRASRLIVLQNSPSLNLEPLVSRYTLCALVMTAQRGVTEHSSTRHEERMLGHPKLSAWVVDWWPVLGPTRM